MVVFVVVLSTTLAIHSAMWPTSLGLFDKMVIPSQPVSSSRVLPLHLTFSALSPGFFTCPNHCNLFVSIATGSTFASFKISSFVRCFNGIKPFAHRAILIYVLAFRFHLLLTLAMFRSRIRQGRSNQCLVYQLTKLL